MPDLTGHQLQARENRRSTLGLVQAQANDFAAMQWATVAAFYCALHCVEAHFATFGVHSRNHADRESLLTEARFRVPRDVVVDYLQLKNWSMQARYLLRQFRSDTVQQLVLPCLQTLTSFVKLDESL